MQNEVTSEVLLHLLRKTGWAYPDTSLELVPGLLEAYQAWHGLKVDGWAGPKTVASLTSKRFCAHPDHFTGPGLGARGINRWGKRLIKIELVGQLGRLTQEQFAEGIITGARYWSEVCDLQFDLVQSNGDLVVSTGRIDGPMGTLAWCELPMVDGHDNPLQSKFDDDERWMQAVPLDAVTAHEFGHGLGLSHTNVARQLMNPTLSNIKTPQAAWDIPEVVKRYGAPKANNPAPPPNKPQVIRMDLTEFDGSLFVNGNRVTL